MTQQTAPFAPTTSRLFADRAPAETVAAPATHERPAPAEPDDHAPAESRRDGFDPARIVWVLTLSALAARLAVVLLLGRYDDSTAMEHAGLARALMLGQGFSFNDSAGYTANGLYEPSSVQSPPYPLILAGFYWLFGTDSPGAYIAAQALNALAGALCVPLLYHAVRRVGGTATVGLAAAALMAFWPTQLFAVAFVQAICLITLGTLGVIVLWYKSLDTGRLAPWVGFGVVGCLAALTEPVLLPAMALSGLMILFHPRLTWPIRLRNAAVLLATAIVVIGPWTYRNYVVHGAFMPIKGTFWVNVWKGNNPNAAGTDRPALSAEQLALFQQKGVDDLRQYDLLTDDQKQRLDGKNTVEREAIWKEYATTFISENPSRYAELIGLRLGKTLWWEWDNPKGHQAFYLYPITRGVLLLGTVLGLILATSRRWRMGWPLVIVGTTLLTYALTVTAARFALPLEPLQFALCGLLLATLSGRLFAERSRPPVVQQFARVNDGRDD